MWRDPKPQVDNDIIYPTLMVPVGSSGRRKVTQACRTVKLAHFYDKRYLADSDSNVKKMQNGGEAVKGRSRCAGKSICAAAHGSIPSVLEYTFLTVPREQSPSPGP